MLYWTQRIKTFLQQPCSVSGNKRAGLCSLVFARCEHLVMHHKSPLCIALNGRKFSSLTKVTHFSCFFSLKLLCKDSNNADSHVRLGCWLIWLGSGAKTWCKLSKLNKLSIFTDNELMNSFTVWFTELYLINWPLGLHTVRLRWGFRLYFILLILHKLML